MEGSVFQWIGLHGKLSAGHKNESSGLSAPILGELCNGGMVSKMVDCYDK